MADEIEMAVFKNHHESSRDSLSLESISLSSSAETVVVVAPPSKPRRKYGLVIPDEVVEQLIRDQNAADLLPKNSNVTNSSLEKVMVAELERPSSSDGSESETTEDLPSCRGLLGDCDRMKPTLKRKYGVRYHGGLVEQLIQTMNFEISPSRKSFTDAHLKKSGLAEKERPCSWNCATPKASVNLPSRCTSLVRLEKMEPAPLRKFGLLQTSGDSVDEDYYENFDWVPSSLSSIDGSLKKETFSEFEGPSSWNGTSSKSTDGFCICCTPVNELRGMDPTPMVERKSVFNPTPKPNVDLEHRQVHWDPSLDNVMDQEEPIYMNLGEFRQDLLHPEPPSLPDNIEQAFLAANAFANQVHQYTWMSHLPNRRLPPDWKKVMKTLSVCSQNLDVPEPREKLYSEFPEFSREQVKLFNQIYFTFMDEESGLFCLREFDFLMRRLANHLDHWTLEYIFGKADQKSRGSISVREFIELFRQACQDNFSDHLLVFKHIVQQTRDHATTYEPLPMVKFEPLLKNVPPHTVICMDPMDSQTDGENSSRGLAKRFRSAFSGLASKFK